MEIPVATSVKSLPRWSSGLRSRSVVGLNPTHASTGISDNGISMLEFHCRVKWFLIVNDLSCCDSHFPQPGGVIEPLLERQCVSHTAP